MNTTSQIQIARISNVPRWCFERVVFPGERLLFETLPNALLEIHTSVILDHHGVSANDSDTQPARLLAVFVIDTDEKNLTTRDKE